MTRLQGPSLSIITRRNPSVVPHLFGVDSIVLSVHDNSVRGESSLGNDEADATLPQGPGALIIGADDDVIDRRADECAAGSGDAGKPALELQGESLLRQHRGLLVAHAHDLESSVAGN